MAHFKNKVPLTLKKNIPRPTREEQKSQQI